MRVTLIGGPADGLTPHVAESLSYISYRELPKVGYFDPYNPEEQLEHIYRIEKLQGQKEKFFLGVHNLLSVDEALHMLLERYSETKYNPGNF